MPHRESPSAAGQAHDDLDDLLNYDPGMDDLFGDGNTAENNGAANISRNDGNGAGLGIDEEIKLAKKRKPVAKLDQQRLLSASGLPKLRRISKEKLKFRGKGHEFSDMSRLLTMYQLWLDDLYPRAKFADGLAIIEKLGHSKSMQITRRQWIDEGKLPPSMEDLQDAPSAEDRPLDPLPSSASHQNLFEDPEPADGDRASLAPQSHDQREIDDEPDEAAAGVEPDEDELDALLAEDPSDQPPSKGLGSKSGLSAVDLDRPDDVFEDEMEAMAGMEDMW